MALTSSSFGAREFSPMRPIVAGLFLSSCLLSIVSWYTTQQGMALYLSPWFSLLASLGVQSALVLVAWLIGADGPPRPGAGARDIHRPHRVPARLCLGAVLFRQLRAALVCGWRRAGVARQRDLHPRLPAQAHAGLARSGPRGCLRVERGRAAG